MYIQEMKNMNDSLLHMCVWYAQPLNSSYITYIACEEHLWDKISLKKKYENLSNIVVWLYCIVMWCVVFILPQTSFKYT